MADKVKKFFLWLLTVTGLVLLLIGSVQLLNLGLKVYIFTKADEQFCPKPYYPVLDRMYDKDTTPIEDRELVEHNRQLCLEERTARRQQDAAQALAFIIVGLPVFIGFYRQARKA